MLKVIRKWYFIGFVLLIAKIVSNLFQKMADIRRGFCTRGVFSISRHLVFVVVFSNIFCFLKSSFFVFKNKSSRTLLVNNCFGGQFMDFMSFHTFNWVVIQTIGECFGNT